jgi:hypothetical protein
MLAEDFIAFQEFRQSFLGGVISPRFNQLQKVE